MCKNFFQFVVITTFLSFALQVNAQGTPDWTGYHEGTMFPGYVITNNGETIEGFIKCQLLASPNDLLGNNQNSVLFYTDPKNSKTKVVYKPKDLKEYKMGDKVYRSMNYSGGLSAKVQRFLLLIEDGTIAKYLWYDNDGTVTHPNYVSKVVVQKKNETPIGMQDFVFGFAKKMTALVKENAELVDKINKKGSGYGITNIDKIIEEYNQWVENNK